ncbi:MAG: EbhA [Lachnospiraceae bacterium]|nr:EbhA [Lachnospiraceae bacterium]
MKRVTKIIILIAAVIAIIALGYMFVVKPHNEAVKKYDDAYNCVYEKNKSLDASINELQKIIDSGEQPFEEIYKTNALEELQTAEKTKVVLPEKMPWRTKDIIAATESINVDVDYYDILHGLRVARVNLENSIKQLKQVTNPNEKFIIERLSRVEGVKGIEAVTEDNDPNGLLNKQGGYTASIYFEYEGIEADGDYIDIVDKGTDGGGCIEVYANPQDAEKRAEYINSVDIFYSAGSRDVVGTCLIRVSDYLTASQQKDIEERIVKELIELD